MIELHFGVTKDVVEAKNKGYGSRNERGKTIKIETEYPTISLKYGGEGFHS